MSWDFQLEQWINGPAGAHPVLDTIMRAGATWGEPLFIALVAIWFAYGWASRRARERQGALTALLAAGGALLINFVITEVWSRPRPFVTHPDLVRVLVNHNNDAAFPSDHAAAGFAICVVLLLSHRRLAMLAIAFAMIMSYARVYVGDHYPTDVLAGAAIGLLTGTLLTTVLWQAGLLARVLTDWTMRLLHLLPPSLPAPVRPSG